MSRRRKETLRYHGASPTRSPGCACALPRAGSDIVEPSLEIIDSVRARRPNAKVIAFAKGAGILLKRYRQDTRADAIGLDWSVPLSFAAELQKDGPVQGNLDPMRVVAGGTALHDGIEAILQVLGQGPLIFNLGHGITPQADPAHVTDLVNQVRNIR